MKQIKFGSSDLKVPAVILGCMRMNQLSVAEAARVIEVSAANGITFFDHADIYGQGACEEIFGQALKQTSLKRDELFIQSKCGIRPGIAFDFSREHLIQSVEGILTRLQIDTLDALLLHRPDTLVEPEEVARAFEELHQSGKVKHFGVSNQKPMQIELLKKYVSQPLVANQLQFGIMHTGMIDQGIQVNMTSQGSFDHDGSILDYSRLNEMTIQAWSPYQFGFFEGVFLDNPQFPELNQKLQELADKYRVTPTGLATAWILRHPAQMQTILGTMKDFRIEEVAQASEVVLTREDWYDIYKAAGNILP